MKNQDMKGKMMAKTKTKQKEVKVNKNTEQKIIDVAIKLFGQKGFDGASTRDICNMAEVNISMIAYYFGGKKELYERAVKNIVEKILNHMKTKMDFDKIPEDLDVIPLQNKLLILYKALDAIIDYFYSDEISDAELMLLYKEQMQSGVQLNSEGYMLFKRLFASILGRKENDKEVIFRTMTIIGQIHSARIMKQFSLSSMAQSGYSKSDIQMLKRIITEQITLILKGIGA